MSNALISAYRHSSTSSLQLIEKQLFRDVKRLIRYQGAVPAEMSENYDAMILARFNALNELEKRL